MRDITELVKLMAESPICFLAGRFAPLQGSLWSFRRGVGYYAWKEYDHRSTPSDMQRLRAEKGWVGSDQVYFSSKFYGEKARIQARRLTWRNGVHQYLINSSSGKRNCRIMFFAGGTKPWHPTAQKTVPEVHAQYMRFMHDHT